MLQPKGVRLSAFLEESAAPSAISPEHSGSEDQRLPSGLRVLLADDMPLNNKLLGHALRKCRADWVIESCLSVDEALERVSAAAAEQKPYDLCVVDEHMSDAPDAMVGSQAIAVMREREREGVVARGGASVVHGRQRDGGPKAARRAPTARGRSPSQLCERRAAGSPSASPLPASADDDGAARLLPDAMRAAAPVPAAAPLLVTWLKA